MKNNIQKILMINLGLLPNYVGFRYISEGVKCIIESKEHYKITDLYKEIARIYDKKVSQIESGIRNAKAKIDYNSVTAKEYNINPKMANGELLYVLAMDIGELF